MAVILSVFSALCYGAGDFAGSLATRKNHVFAVLVFSQFFGLLSVLLIIPFLGFQLPSATDLLWGAAAGLGGAFGLVLIYSGIARYGAGIVSPTGALVGTAIPVLFGIFLGEQPGPTGWIGIVTALPAILLLTAEPRPAGKKAMTANSAVDSAIRILSADMPPGGVSGDSEKTQAFHAGTGSAVIPERPPVPGTDARNALSASKAALLSGIAAGAGFGVFFIAISRASGASGLWPLVGARAASLTAGILVLLFSGTPFRLAKEHRWAMPAAGILDMAANVLFLLAVRSGLLVLVAVITSLYPAPTVVLSRFAFGEKLTPHRIAGIALAIAGVALMSV